VETGTTSATRGAWWVTYNLANSAATNVQFGGGTHAGIRGDGSRSLTTLVSNTIGAEDSTAAKTFAVSVQWTVASTNNSWRARYGILELV
jgi:hypothetical protein